MNNYIIFLLINFGINFIFANIMYRMYKNYEDLGNSKVPYKLYYTRYFGKLKNVYYMEIEYKGKYIKQTISEKDFYDLDGYNETFVYIRKFKKSILNPDLVEYQFKLDESNWNEKDKWKCIKGGIYLFVVIGILGSAVFYEL